MASAADIRAEQHAPGGIERDLGLDRQMDAGLFEGFLNAGDGGFDFEDVLRGFDQQQIHAAAHQAEACSRKTREFVEADIGEFGIAAEGSLPEGPMEPATKRWCDF